MNLRLMNDTSFTNTLTVTRGSHVSHLRVKLFSLPLTGSHIIHLDSGKITRRKVNLSYV